MRNSFFIFISKIFNVKEIEKIKEVFMEICELINICAINDIDTCDENIILGKSYFLVSLL